MAASPQPLSVTPLTGIVFYGSRLFSQDAKSAFGNAMPIERISTAVGSPNPITAMCTKAVAAQVTLQDDPIVIIEADLFGPLGTLNRFAGVARLRAFLRAENANADPIVVLATQTPDNDRLPAREAGVSVIIGGLELDERTLQVRVKAVRDERVQWRSEKTEALAALNDEWQERNRRTGFQKIAMAALVGVIAFCSGFALTKVGAKPAPAKPVPAKTTPASQGPTWSTATSFQRIDDHTIQGYLALGSADPGAKNVAVEVATLPSDELVRVTGFPPNGRVPARAADEPDGYPFQLTVVGKPDELTEHLDTLAIELCELCAANPKKCRWVSLPKEMILRMSHRLHAQAPPPSPSAGTGP